MDDSDQDFVVLFSKALKRVRKKPEKSSRPNKKEDSQSSQPSVGNKRRQVNKKDGAPRSNAADGSQAVCPETTSTVVGTENGHDSGDVGPSPSGLSAEPAEMGLQSLEGCTAKEKVLIRMQQFKRASPQKMVHRQTKQENETDPLLQHSSNERAESCLLNVDSDEALALHLQQELDREAAAVQTVNLEDGGLYFCQICQRDLSHMTPEGRMQHTNRCLDESEHPHPDPPSAAAGLPDCPICGQKFKSQKSRSSHLKRCSSDMGVSPAVLLQALQRQREEVQHVAQPIVQTGGTKRKGAFKHPAQKKSRKKTEPLDEETMVALALSSSLLEQETEQQRDTAAVGMSLKWCADAAGKSRGKKRRGAVTRPPPLLLIQDAEEALKRLQDRVSALLLQNRAPSPPTPTLCPSSLPAWSGTAPLWQKSALVKEAAITDFYSPELQEFIQPWKPPVVAGASSDAIPKQNPCDPPARESTPITKPPSSTLPSSQTASCSSAPSTPGTLALPMGSQSLRDLMELAEDGLTFTQCGFSAEGCVEDKRSCVSSNLQLSGFLPHETSMNSKQRVSGFLPEATLPVKEGAGGANTHSGHRFGALSRLSSDLSSMVNNPQLSDVQLQVDSGEVYFAHSFMLYARCPLLAEMVHEEAFGVKEEGLAEARRVLITDVPGEAVLALLQFLYTAQVSLTASLLPHVLELASRYDLQELQQLCELGPDETTTGRDDDNMVQEHHPSNVTDQFFMELIHSMWREEEEDENQVEDGERDDCKGLEVDGDEVAPGGEELQEELVNEEELEEIYEFAATQRKKEEELDSVEEERNTGEKFTQLKSPSGLSKVSDCNLESTYNRLFSDSDGGDPEDGAPKSTPPKTHSSFKAPAYTLLHSSGSVVDDLPFSPRTSNLPLAGVSPVDGDTFGAGGEAGHNSSKEDLGVKRESQGPRTICSPASLVPPLLKKEPELIVLSDSSDDGEGAALQSPVNPPSSPDLPAPNDVAETLKPSLSPVAQHQPAPSCEQSLDDCSPEVSWLIPSTPVQPRKQSSAEAKRLQLFPKSDSSSHSSPHSPDDSKAPLQVSASFSAISRLQRSQEVSVSVSPCSVMARPPPCPSASIQHTPMHQQHKVYSSTPVNLQVSDQPLALPAPSPLDTTAEKQSLEQSRSPEEKEVGSFHLDPMSDFSEEPPCSDLRMKSSSDSAGVSKSSGVQDRRSSDEGETRETSFQQSFMFMDEPPMAFNDSWGLDACVDAPENPGCFSLRLEDSGDRECPSPPNKPATPPQVRPFHAPDAGSPEHQAASSSFTQEKPEVGLLDSRIWDSWEEDEEEEPLTLAERLNPPPQLKTPAAARKKRRSLVPITPMPHYSDMDTPELKNKLNRFGVRPLPKRQMVLKLKEIHQYTHQLVSSDSEGEPPSARTEGPAVASVGPGRRLFPSTHSVTFKEPRAPPASSPAKYGLKESEREAESLSASQDSTTSSTAESDRSNPELCLSSDGDSDSDGVVSASQAVSRLQERLQAVRSFILSDPALHSQILQYQPLVLSDLQRRLKEAGVRLGAAKLMDYLDSQCITFTTAKPGQAAPTRRRVKKTGSKVASRKRAAPAV
ncbi:structure-specific endonuclease subunit SLX4-like [Synchiropus splendidus]|uniref:structure-specific endonuclease subunit SLX4-like n=1 Tax=Synchiropus splendidus TaxID=270530 RepID=UPI00237D838B|nr:structure-specific endonuclease subunit SLX4-like [Synchiropus splendidus]